MIRREWVGDHAAHAAVNLPLDDGLIEEGSLAADVAVTLVVTAGEIRRLFDDDTPVPAACEVRVGEEHARVLASIRKAAAIRVGADLRIQIVIAEHVAPVERQSAAHKSAES